MESLSTAQSSAVRHTGGMNSGVGRISYNGALCIGILNRMGRVDRSKWVVLHCCHQDIISLYDTTFRP